MNKKQQEFINQLQVYFAPDMIKVEANTIKIINKSQVFFGMELNQLAKWAEEYKFSWDLYSFIEPFSDRFYIRIEFLG